MSMSRSVRRLQLEMARRKQPNTHHSSSSRRRMEMPRRPPSLLVVMVVVMPSATVCRWRATRWRGCSRKLTRLRTNTPESKSSLSPKPSIPPSLSLFLSLPLSLCLCLQRAATADGRTTATTTGSSTSSPHGHTRRVYAHRPLPSASTTTTSTRGRGHAQRCGCGRAAAVDEWGTSARGAGGRQLRGGHLQTATHLPTAAAASARVSHHRPNAPPSHSLHRGDAATAAGPLCRVCAVSRGRGASDGGFGLCVWRGRGQRGREGHRGGERERG
mmetsp:Transcript_23993/g.69116  ORF Transcript_23993/g.69116 Transcript_23993/m.69116 type:complete len:272 (+) Transcript_23993:528-1343(+)